MTTSTGLLNTSSLRSSQALQILQDHSVSGIQAQAQMTGDGATSPYAWVAVAGQAGRAVSAIMEILLDANGNEQMAIQAKGGAAGARAGGGNDVLAFDVGQTERVSAGGGNDTIAIKAYGAHDEIAPGYDPAVYDTEGGAGDDTISIQSDGSVDITQGGDGNDSITISSTDMVDRTEGGSGDDTIDIQGGRLVSRVMGGDGNDIIRVVTTNEGTASAAAVIGIDADGAIHIAPDQQTTADSIDGDAGDDTIEVTADRIGVNGGTGNDTIILHNTGTQAAQVGLQAGGGQDDVTSDGAVSFIGRDGQGHAHDLSDALIERVDVNTLKVTYDGLGDSVTLHLTGKMADQPLAIDFDESGAMTIRRADTPNTDPLLALHPVTETRTV